MNIHELIKEEIDNYLREEEYFTNQLPDDRKAHKNRYIGRNVVWYGSPEQMIVVDKDNVHGMWGNIYDNDKLKYVEDIIRNSDDYVELECSYALASVVRLIDVIEHQTSEKNDHFYTDYDGFDSPHSTGNPEVDTYLGTEDMDDLAFVSDWVSQLEIIKFFEDHKLDIVGGENSLESLKQQFLQLNPDEEEMEAFEGFIALEEAVKEAYDTNSGDLGDLSVQLRDAHHRVFGAIAAGENFICVNLDVNDIQRFSDYITRVGTSGPVPEANLVESNDEDKSYHNGMLEIDSITKYNNPDWKPLYKFLEQIFHEKHKDAADAYMWYGTYLMEDTNMMVNLYRHGISRRYFHLDENGNFIDIDWKKIGSSSDYHYDNVRQKSMEYAFNYIYHDLAKYLSSILDIPENELPRDIYSVTYKEYAALRDKKLKDKGFNIDTVTSKEDILYQVFGKPSLN